jgi:hypothetical protein
MLRTKQLFPVLSQSPYTSAAAHDPPQGQSIRGTREEEKEMNCLYDLALASLLEAVVISSVVTKQQLIAPVQLPEQPHLDFAHPTYSRFKQSYISSFTLGTSGRLNRGKQKVW